LEGSSVETNRPPVRPRREDHWKDLFDAIDMFDPRFPIKRNQPTEPQVRKSLDELFPPRSRRTKRAK
jgi:hypothetical protein